MRIAISGSTGLIGATLVDHFLKKNDTVIELTRRASLGKSKTSVAVWDPSNGTIEAPKMEAQEVVIHLAGANISERWTPEYKTTIESSRVDGTRLLCQALARMQQKPKLLISASAVGFYGNHEPAQVFDESSPSGEGFLSQVCRRWEEETRYAKDAGIRVVNLRFGVVLGKSGGAMAKMLPIFNLGLGGVLGNGRQMMSWIALPEIPGIIEFLIKNNAIEGPVNAVTPQPVANKEFTKALGRAIGRPVILPVPAFGIKMLFGEMGQTLLLEGVRVAPKRLVQSGYCFRYPGLTSALDAVLK
jgi:uncharacterized protein (TIGR01777 family)